MRTIRQTLQLGKMMWSFVDLVRHPDHLDRVFEIADSLVTQRLDVLEGLHAHFAREARGATALRDKPRLRVDLDALSRLPQGTLGRAFAAHMHAEWAPRSPPLSPPCR